MKDVELTVDRGGVRLSARLIPVGDDLCAIVFGGDCPHIGSAALGVPRPSLRDAEKMSSTVSTLNLTGHRDDAVANLFSSHLTAALGRPVAVVCGIHIDGITQEQLRLVWELSNSLLDDCLRAIRSA